MFEINLFSSIAIAQGLLPGMVTKGRGRIVFVSSMAGLWTVPFAAGYSASKHALEAIAEGLKAELAPLGIKIATVNPGMFGTGFNDRGADTMSHWYEPTKSFTPPQLLEGLQNALAHQLDPRAMADVIVDVVLSETPKFRNVFPQETEDLIRQVQRDTWDAKTDVPSSLLEIFSSACRKNTTSSPPIPVALIGKWRCFSELFGASMSAARAVTGPASFRTKPNCAHHHVSN